MRTSTLYVRQFALAWFVILLMVFAATAQTTTFTYQGKLTDDYSQPTGAYDLQFNLYDEVTGMHTALNATPIVLEEVQVTNGMFTVALDFGNLFDGGDRYLEISVRPASDTGAFAVLNPRQRITSLPYAIRSLSAATANTAANAENLGGTAPGSFVQITDARLTDARPPTAGSSNYIQNASSLQPGANFNIAGTGTASVFNAATQFNLGGTRVLSVASTASGGDNLFAGVNSGMNNTTGNNDAFVGYHAGSNNTTGSGNSFFGSGAGFGNHTGQANTAVGQAAGSTITTGSYNVSIGYSTGNNGNAGSHNTILGALAATNPNTDPILFASAIGSYSVAMNSDTIVLGKVAGVYDGISRPADKVQIPGSLQVTGSITAGTITATTFNGSGLTNINASNITTGTLDNARLGVVPINRGGTGLTSPGASGNFLRSNGTGFASAPLQLGDMPDLSASYIRNQTGAAQSGGFSISGNGTAGVFNALTQFNLGGSRVLSVAGEENIFAGFNAGAVNTAGNRNSFFGYNAGAANTTGRSNSFFGRAAGVSNVSGINNTFVGSDAGTSNTAGNENEFLGASAGQNNTTGSSNSFLGTSSGNQNTTGHSNVFLGSGAGIGNATGSRNSFVGRFAGEANATGGNNTIIGYSANVTAPDLLFATAIGSHAKVGASDTIVLGKAAGDYGFGQRPADTVIIPGDLTVLGTINGGAGGSNPTNVDASNITTGTLADARLSANVAILSGTQNFTGAKVFSGGVSGDGSGLTGLSASNITTGTLNSARLGVVGIGNGGTGLTSPGAEGNFLRSNGVGFTSYTLAAADIPAGSVNYIQNTTTQQVGTNFNISGNGAVGGDLSVGGALNASGAGLNNLNASNITVGTLDNARLGSIPTANIADGAISTPKLADSAVTAAKIGNNQVVKNVNGLTDGVNLAAGANVTITPSGNTLTISAAGGDFIQNSTTQQPGSNFNLSGDGTAANLTASSTLSGNVVNATTQFNLGGSRVLSIAGSHNVFVGYSAGIGNVSGYSNAFFGYFAGIHNTLGSQNVFLGANTGVANTTGSANSFVGYGTGYGNTSGLANTFFGTFAGYNNTTGVNNTFVGVNAGLNNTTGYFNLFDGLEAGKSNTEGYFNSFVGPNSGYGNTSGYYNSFFGFQAGYTNTTGNNNTIIGTYADVSSNNLSFATAVGAYATVATSNTIALGRANGSDKVRIFGLGTAGTTQLCRNANNEVSTCSSSLRYKTNVAPFSPGLGLLQRLRPIRFDWKDGGMKDVGFGAEDVAAVEPLLVTYDDKGRVEGVKYDRISTVLVNAVKEQQTQIETQQVQINQQRAQIETQQQQLRQQQTLIDGLKKILCPQNPTAEVCQ